jgi:hypothetical protein
VRTSKKMFKVSYIFYFQRNPSKVKPFLLLIALGIGGAFMHGITLLSFNWILIGMTNVYFLIVVYSIYELLQFEVEQKSHQNSSSSQVPSQCYDDPELYNDSEKGYQGYQDN